MPLSPQKIDFDEVWGVLAINMKKMLLMQKVQGSSMWEDVYKLCTAQGPYRIQDLYFLVKSLLEVHVQSLKDVISSYQSESVLSIYHENWVNFCLTANAFNNIFQYLNNLWVRKKRSEGVSRIGFGGNVDVYEIGVLCLIVWKEQLFENLKDRIISSLISELKNERDGKRAESSLIIGIIESYVKLGQANNRNMEFYQTEFEYYYLQELQRYYSLESSSFIAEHGISNYLKKAETRLIEEENRSKRYLLPSSYEKVNKMCTQILIENHRDLLDSECLSILKEDRRQDLSRMYRILLRSDTGISGMTEPVFTFLTNQGLERIKTLVNSSSNETNPQPSASTTTTTTTTTTSSTSISTTSPSPSTSLSTKNETSFIKLYIEELISINSEYVSLVQNCFNNDKHFVAVLDKTCRKIVNENSFNLQSTRNNTHKTSEYLAKYCDQILRKGNKSFDNQNLDKTIEHILGIFKYIDAKDVFQAFYSKLLARRLIHSLSVSDDAESTIIGGFKQTCGFEFTSKLQRMFTDMTLCSDLNERYQEYLKDNNSKNTSSSNRQRTEFEVLVLTSGSWPLQPPTTSFNLPVELSDIMKSFQDYYQERFYGRKLNWLFHLSKIELKTNHLKKVYELQVTSYQYGCLNCWNNPYNINNNNNNNGGDQDIESELNSDSNNNSNNNDNIDEKLSWNHIQKETNLSDLELKRALMPLIESKIILKDSKTKQISTTDTFCLNPNFTSKRRKLKINTTSYTETPAELEGTQKRIEDDRKFYIQAAIVRIMKSRRVMNHSQLISEVLELSKTRFHPDTLIIKRSIEQLIEKEYLKRDENDSQKYLYVM